MQVEDNALSNNQRLFDVYAKKLCSSDVRTFSDVAEKLSTWLNNPKAYYSAARPEIIKLLTIAQSTVQAAVGHTNLAEPFHVSRYNEHPLVQPYAKLMQVVQQYTNHFVEQDLGACIRQLVGTVSVLLPSPEKVPSQEVHDTTVVSSSNEAQVTQSPPNISSASVSSVTAVKGNASLVATDPSTSESDKPQPVTSSTMVTVPPQGASQRVKRKRKTLDQLVDVDQKRFRLNMANGQANIASSSLNKEANTTQPVDTKAHSVDATRPSENAVSQASSQVTPVPTNGATAISPDPSSQSFVNKINPNEANTASPEEHLVLKGSEEQHNQSVESGHISFPQDTAGITTQDMGSTGPVANAGRKTGNISAEPLQINTNHAGNGLKSTESGVMPSEQAHEGRSAIPPTNGGAEGKNGDDAMQVDDVDEQLVREQVTLESDDTGFDSVSFQEQVVKGIQRLHAQLTRCASLIPHAGQDIESVISQDQDDKTFCREENVSDKTGIVQIDEIEEPVSHKIGSPEVDIPGASNEVSVLHQSPEKIKVSTLIRGLSNSGVVKIDFEIKVGIYSALLHWTRCQPPTRNVGDGICVTLGCYNASEAALKAASSKNERDWRMFVSSHQPSWPRAGGLQLLLNGKKRYDLPLSSPLTTQGGLLDLSPYLVEGANGIELHSTRDMSKYIFALVLHPPTPAQLVWKSERYRKDKDWKDWVKVLTRPFNLNPVPLLKR